MSLLTKDKLQEMFSQSKARQRKNREEKKKQRILAYKAICKHQDQVLKKSFREEKKKLMDNLFALIKKTPQNGWKPSQIESCFYFQDTWQLKEPNEDDLYNTRQELMEAQERGEGAINWDVWDKLIEKTKKQINEQR